MISGELCVVYNNTVNTVVHFIKKTQ